MVPTHGPCWQMISAGCSLFTWDATLTVDKKRYVLFGHVVRLMDTSVQVCTPSLEASHCNESWPLLRYELAKTSCTGRPRKTWIQQIGDGTTTSWKQMWQSAEERGYRGEPSQRYR